MANPGLPDPDDGRIAMGHGSKDVSMRDQPPSEAVNGLDSNCAASSTSVRLPYVPQFSTTTSFILSRMKSTNGDLNSALSEITGTDVQLDAGVFEDARSRLMQSLNDSSTMPLPITQDSLGLSPLGISNLSSVLGIKRKRDSDAEQIDFSQNTMPFPIPPQHSTQYAPITKAPEGAVVNAPKQCTVCGLHSSTFGNTIIQCSRCFDNWHQKCASPEVPSEACLSGTFQCSNCTVQPVARTQSLQDRGLQIRVERLREKQLSGLPRGINPAKPELVGFGAGQSSDHARTEYFYSKKKTDLLNILSFCDQLKPQLLVDILVSVSKKHPDLPIFDHPKWESLLPSADHPELNTNTPKARSEHKQRHGHTLANQKIRPKQRPSKKVAKLPPTLEVDTVMTHEEGNLLPPTWRKAGEGYYAKLTPEVEDRTFLADENDEEAFSQFMVDGSGKQIIEAV